MLSERNDWGDFRPILSQWRIGALAALAVFGACIVVIFSLEPSYKASVQLLLPVSAKEDPGERKNAPQQADAIVIHSFSDIILDEGIARRVIEDLHLATNPEFNKPPGLIATILAWPATLLRSDGPSTFTEDQIKAGALLQDYEGRLKAVNESKTLTMTLSFQSSDPFLSRDIVNAHATAFIQAEVKRRRTFADTKVKWMRDELDRAAADLKAAQDAVQLHVAIAPGSKNGATDQSELRFRQIMAQSKQAAYEAMLTRYQNVIAESSYSGSEIEILSAATVPTRPDFPKKLLMSAAAAFVSLFVGFGAAWIASIAKRVVTADEIAKRLKLPLLGKLNFPGRPLFGVTTRRTLLRRAFFWEQIAEIRSCLDVPSFRPRKSTRSRRPPGTVIAVTSAHAKEGKSLLAAALSRTLACSGARTVLVDLNTRSPNFRAPLSGQERAIGLQDVLAGEASIGQAAVSIDEQTPLYLMAISPNLPADIFAFTGPKMRALMSALKKEFDVIVVDTPALDTVSDTLLIGALVDQVIVAATLRQSGVGSIDREVGKLRARSIPLLGVVITDHRRPLTERFSQLAPYIKGQRPHVIWPSLPSAIKQKKPRQLLSFKT